MLTRTELLHHKLHHNSPAYLDDHYAYQDATKEEDIGL